MSLMSSCCSAPAPPSDSNDKLGKRFDNMSASVSPLKKDTQHFCTYSRLTAFGSVFTTFLCTKKVMLLKLEKRAALYIQNLLYYHFKTTDVACNLRIIITGKNACQILCSPIPSVRWSNGAYICC